MKKIEDYLHLYLGCEVQWWNNDGVYTLDADKLAEIYEDDLWKGTKPILRQLSDMSVEESYEAWKLSGEHIHHMGVCNYKSAFLHPGTDLDMGLTEWAIVVKYFLSKHFDLFGLIEAGLAIDKTNFKKSESITKCLLI